MKHINRVGYLAGLAILTPLLTGCFPLVATGVVGTGLVATDRRTPGAQLDDQGIEIHADRAISNQFGDKLHVVSTSYNRNLLLTGEVPDAKTRSELETLARTIVNVRTVVDETAIAGNSSLTQRTSDTYLSVKVHTRLVTEARDHYSSLQIGVTTENGVVYLTGLVTRSEGSAAAQVVSTTSGVARVVKVFEYIDTEPAPATNRRPISGIRSESGPPPPVETQAPAPQTEETLPAADPVKL